MAQTPVAMDNPATVSGRRVYHMEHSFTGQSSASDDIPIAGLPLFGTVISARAQFVGSPTSASITLSFGDTDGFAESTNAEWAAYLPADPVNFADRWTYRKQSTATEIGFYMRIGLDGAGPDEVVVILEVLEGWQT